MKKIELHVDDSEGRSVFSVSADSVRLNFGIDYVTCEVDSERKSKQIKDFDVCFLLIVCSDLIPQSSENYIFPL